MLESSKRETQGKNKIKNRRTGKLKTKEKWKLQFNQMGQVKIPRRPKPTPITKPNHHCSFSLRGLFRSNPLALVVESILSVQALGIGGLALILMVLLGLRGRPHGAPRLSLLDRGCAGLGLCGRHFIKVDLISFVGK